MQQVLGHRNPNTTLNYTSIILIPTFKIEKNKKDYDAIISKLVNRIERLENTKRERDEDTDDEKDEDARRMPKLPRGTPIEERGMAIVHKIEELEADDIMWTWRSLAAMGASVMTVTTRITSAHPITCEFQLTVDLDDTEGKKKSNRSVCRYCQMECNQSPKMMCTDCQRIFQALSHEQQRRGYTANCETKEG